MSLLSDLRTTAPTEDGAEPAFMMVKRTLPLLVPGAEVTKLEVHSDGRVGLRAKAPMRATGAVRYYVVARLEPVGTGLPDGRREVRLAVARYRDEADSTFYHRPFSGWIAPQPGALVAWIAGILLTETEFSDNRITA